MLIVSYDFANDKIRARFAKLLKKYGRRLQYSVFEMKNSQRVLQNILKEVEYLYKKRFDNTDSVLIINVCEACRKKVIRYGYTVNEEKEVVFF